MTQCISVIFSFAINAVIIDVVLENFIENPILSFAASFLFVTVFTSMYLTPVGTIIMRFQLKMRGPTQSEYERIKPIFDAVYQRAKEKNPGLPNDIRWFMEDDSAPNAFAVGRHTIGFTTGLLSVCTDNEIAAVLGHEFGHIAHWDVVRSVLLVESNFIFVIFQRICVLLVKLICFGVGLIFSMMDNNTSALTISEYAGRFFAWLTNWYISIIYYICIIPSYAASRRQEFAADKFSAQLGLYSGLISFFTRYKSQPNGFIMTIKKMLYGTHPSNEKRVERLNEFVEKNARTSAAG